VVQWPGIAPWSTALIPDNPNWRRHKNACIFYRERWCAEEEQGDEGCVLLYQIICLQGTPPLNPDEQEQCMKPRTSCWRNPAIKCTKAAAAASERVGNAAV
jgi:hypothetical protein